MGALWYLDFVSLGLLAGWWIHRQWQRNHPPQDGSYLDALERINRR